MNLLNQTLKGVKMNKLSFFIVSFCLVLASTVVFAETKMSSASYIKCMEFKNGDAPNQLCWLAEEDGSPTTGPLVGPMSFITLPNGNIWIADTQNVRLCLFSSEGKNLKEIDFIKLGKSAGLAEMPALADICLLKNNILLADANNNLIIDFNPDNLKMRFFKPSGKEKGNWIQINHIYTDNKDRIYVDDLASGKIIVLDNNGGYLGENAAASIAVSPIDSRMASIHYVESENGETDSDYYQLAVNKGFDTPWFPVVNISSDENIMQINVIGIDKENNIYVLYGTEFAYFYNVYTFEGELKKSIETSIVDSGYNPARHKWINESGDIFAVTVKDKSLKIMKLVEEN